MVLAEIGIVITWAVVAVAAFIVAVVYFVTMALFANPDGTFDYWVEISDINTFVIKYNNQQPCDFGIMDSYIGLNRNHHYIPIPYGPV